MNSQPGDIIYIYLRVVITIFLEIVSKFTKGKGKGKTGPTTTTTSSRTDTGSSSTTSSIRTSIRIITRGAALVATPIQDDKIDLKRMYNNVMEPNGDDV